MSQYNQTVKRDLNSTLSPSAPTGIRPDSNAIQAKYFVDQLEVWATQIERDISGRRPVDAISHAKRRELCEVRRQIDALHARYPLMFDERRGGSR